MVTYIVYFGNGTAWLSQESVTLEESTTDFGAIIDMAIDQVEEKGYEGYFLNPSELFENGGEIYPDEYVIGGNHGRILYHGGNLIIEEMNEV